MRFGSHILVLSLILLHVLATFSSCKREREADGDTGVEIATDYQIKYAKGFDIQYFKKYKKLTIKSPYPDSKQDLVYILTRKDNGATDEPEHIQIPLSKIVATSTTHVPMLEILGAADVLAGFPNAEYISSPETRNRIDGGKLAELWFCTFFLFN